jgi:hypothetical protein
MDVPASLRGSGRLAPGSIAVFDSQSLERLRRADQGAFAALARIVSVLGERSMKVRCCWTAKLLALRLLAPTGTHAC